MALVAAKKVRQRKYTYTRNPLLTIQGRMLIMKKLILDCRLIGTPPTEHYDNERIVLSRT